MPLDDNDGEIGSGSGSDDPGRLSPLLKLLSQRQDGNATDPESVVEGTPQKKIDKQEGLSVASDFQRYSVPPIVLRL